MLLDPRYSAVTAVNDTELYYLRVSVAVEP